MSIHDKIRAFLDATSENGRLRSWDHCYEYFNRLRRGETSGDRDHSALQLGFYLASWGMYRGSSFLLQYDYTIHREVVDRIFATRFDRLWEHGFGAKDDDIKLCPTIVKAAEAIREVYLPFAEREKASGVTDTLVSKIILGTYSCLPAFDQYFRYGWQIERLEHPYSSLNLQSIERVLDFCREHLAEFQEEQALVQRERAIEHYPLDSFGGE